MNKALLAGFALLVCFALIWRYFFWVPTVTNFAEAKAALEDYVVYDHRVTLYCGAEFSRAKQVEYEPGFFAKIYKKRADKVEWEHIVPVADFVGSFTDKKRGRKYARRVSPEFNRMEADMYNLFPAIGAVNAARKTYEYALLPDEEPAFGSCTVKIARKKFEPPERARGPIARASLYMDERYPQFELSDSQRQLFEEWNSEYPVNEWECLRTKRIERIQKNENRFVKAPCQKAGWW